ncbi:hypothetical protein GYMLUDRAFT_49207 [Collybiopsis luxurians FD-317 M1]|uniref:DNA damage-binding protein 1 n=1 Tax=Collybiopsis luxurians FD-317 M1 TaxID=944289 RepID=A0A0D0CFQ8_9AGAR|nr:hypothetical protein GYMLUDRAFT_49207 [Collybiopsis luxurians FD-317 M1]
MHALHHEILAPSGVEFAAWVQLATSEQGIFNLVVARSNILKIFELRNVNGFEKFYHIRTHKLHGIVTGLEGVKILGSEEDGKDRLLVGFKDAKIALLEWSPAQYDLITVSIHTYERAPQCLDIKPTCHSILRVDPVSRCAALLLPQDALAILPFHRREHDEHDDTQKMDVDPDADDDVRSRVPYTPSFILSLPISVSSSIHNIIDFVFLPGFHNPTIAVLYSERPTWTGRLKEAKDTCALVIFSMSMSAMTSASATSFSADGLSASMSSATTFSVITSIKNLPYDAQRLIPCTRNVGGGLIVLTTNSLVYVDQATKKLMLPMNGWAERVSEVSALKNPNPTSANPSNLNLSLEGAQATFISDTTLLLVLVHGEVYTVTLAMDGKAVSGMNIGKEMVAKTTIPSLVQCVTVPGSSASTARVDELVFVGSTQGPSVLLRTGFVEEEEPEEDDVNMDDSAAAAAQATEGHGAGTGTGADVEMYDDEDIYGPSTTTTTTEPTPASKPEAISSSSSKTKTTLTKARVRLTLSLSLLDHLPSYGSINSMAFGLTRNGDKPVPQLITATSLGHLGGFVLWQRDLPVRMKRRMGVLGGSRGWWSFKLVGGSGGGGSSAGSGGGEKEKEREREREGQRGIRMVISTDANPSPGFSRITIPSTSLSNISNNDITARISGTTIGAGPFFGGTAVLQVMTGAIRVLEIDGTERQVIKDVESSSSGTAVALGGGVGGAGGGGGAGAVPSGPASSTHPHTPRAKIRACSISDPYVLILREDDTMGLFLGYFADKDKEKDKDGKGKERERERDKDKDGKGKGEKMGKVRRKDMSMLGGKMSKYLTGCFFTDHTGMLEKNIVGLSSSSSSSTLANKVDLGQRTSSGLDNQWLMLVRPQGVMEIWSLPKMVLVFTVGAPFMTLESVLVDEGEGAGVGAGMPLMSSGVTAANANAVPMGALKSGSGSGSGSGVGSGSGLAQTQDVAMKEGDDASARVSKSPNLASPVLEQGRETSILSLAGGGIDQVTIAPLGESKPELHLFVLLRSGQMAIYQAVPAAAPTPVPSSSSADAPMNGVSPVSPTSPASPTLPTAAGGRPSVPPTSASNSRAVHLRIAFVKVFSKTFEIQRVEPGLGGGAGGGPGSGFGNVGPGGVGGGGSSSGSGGGGGFSGGVSVGTDQKKISRMFVPFHTTPPFSPPSSAHRGDGEAAAQTTTYTGVFFTGENPSWIIATDRGGVNLYSSGHSIVHAFTAWEPAADPKGSGKVWGGGNGGEFLVYSDEGPSLLEWIPDFQLELPLPMRSIPRGRAYTSVVFDPSTSLVVAASILEASFASFDEDGNKIWEPDAPNISYPITECSTLELISPDLWISMDGFEFANNEIVNAVACVSLETASTETGLKEFIAVGTTINRGEDLAVKGATYIFEIVEVVADPTSSPKRWYKLRLRCRDDAKGPVTALCGLNGYLVSSMGQKIFVRAFDSDERLVGVAFMDVGVYVTSLRTIKNLLLIGDAVKSIWFVAFQEDPYKLVLLGKDTRHLCVTSSDFFFADNEMAIFTHDEEGIMRLYDYNPQDPESRDGRYLLLRSEFNSQAEYQTTALVARRTSSDTVVPQAKLLCGATNGSIAAITPVEESTAKRLQLLQGQLTRNIQHIAGLNPRAFRIVRNDYVSRPLSKDILDGNLLMHFESSSTTRQLEMTKQIGTEVGVVRRDWITLDGPW